MGKDTREWRIKRKKVKKAFIPSQKWEKYSRVKTILHLSTASIIVTSKFQRLFKKEYSKKGQINLYIAYFDIASDEGNL